MKLVLGNQDSFVFHGFNRSLAATTRCRRVSSSGSSSFSRRNKTEPPINNFGSEPSHLDIGAVRHCQNNRIRRAQPIKFSDVQAIIMLRVLDLPADRAPAPEDRRFQFSDDIDDA